MSLVFPLIAWGAAEAIAGAGWSNVGVPVLTAGQADPFGGTDAVLVEDDDPTAGASEGRLKSLGAYNSDRMLVAVINKAGTAAASDFLVFDSTAALDKLALRFTWTGGVPAVAVTTGGVDATLFGTISLGGGHYLTIAEIRALTVGNNHQLRVYGAIRGGTAVGSTYWYLRNVVLLNHPGGSVSWDEPRDGSERVDGLDGTTDVWLLPKDFRFRGEVNGVPSRPRSLPLLVSGWEGANESIALNCGVQAMLKAGQDARTLTFVPDRADCATSIASKLVKPTKGDRPTTRLNGDRSIGLELRNTSTPYPLPI